MAKQIKQDQGVAGLTILLSLIVMLFVIGLIVMIFALMGSSLSNATYTSTTATATNESVGKTATGIQHSLDGRAFRNGVCGNVTSIFNGTGGIPIGLANFTQGSFLGNDNCVLYNATVTTTWASAILVTYSYTYSGDNTATNVMNDTVSSVGGVTDWFDIFIVIGAMVVLILLTVIIITAIRGSGMVGGETVGGNRVGSA